MSTQWHWYVEINDAQLRELQAGLNIRYHNYGRLHVWRCQKNDVIKFNSLVLTIRDGTMPEIRERLIDYVHGFIQGAKLPSVFSNENNTSL